MFKFSILYIVSGVTLAGPKDLKILIHLSCAFKTIDHECSVFIAFFDSCAFFITDIVQSVIVFIGLKNWVSMKFESTGTRQKRQLNFNIYVRVDVDMIA